MFRSYHLDPLGPGDGPLVFEWDPDTGDVRGRDAEEVRKLAAAAEEAGVVTGLPYPSAHEIRDPLNSAAELAVVLGTRWRLPGDLARAYPAPPGSALPEGAIA